MAARSIIGCARPGCTGAARCAQGRPPDYLDFGKKLFSLLCFRREPVPSTMAAAVGMPAASSRADAAGLAPPAHLAARALLATDSQNNGFNARRHDNHEQATDRSPAAALARGHRRRAKLRHAVRHRRCGRDLSQQRAGRLRGRVHRPFERRPRPATCPAAAGDQGFRGPRRRDARAVRPRERLRHHERHVGAGRPPVRPPGVRRPRQRPLRHGHARPPVHVARRLRGRSARRRILAASARTRATSTTSTRPRGSTARSSTRAPTTRASRSARCTASAASRAA